MRSVEPGLVHIVRDFLAVHRLMQDLVARHRDGLLRFEDLRELVGDDERSVLFRLKERCHAAFRISAEGDGVALQREALFDLTVGSLFHEAMALRENFYQREVYGPRVQALRSRAGGDAPELFEEFDRLLDSVAARLEEGLAESLVLLAQTVEQLRLLIGVHRDDGAVVRFLIENPARVEAVFERPLDTLLAETHGGTADAYRLAGGSYLDSGYYAAAVAAFERALERDAPCADLLPLLTYARGMDAYLRRDYESCLTALGGWADSKDAAAPSRLGLARDAIAGIARLAEADGGARVAADAASLLARLAPPARAVAR